MYPVAAEIVASAKHAVGLALGVQPVIVCWSNRRPHAMTTISSVSSLITSLGEIPPETVIFGHSETMQSLRERMDKVASANVPVLIQGESGTGKDIIARMIHARSPWRTGLRTEANAALYAIIELAETTPCVSSGTSSPGAGGGPELEDNVRSSRAAAMRTPAPSRCVHDAGYDCRATECRENGVTRI